MRQLLAIGQPQDRDYISVQNYIQNTDPIVPSEDFIHLKDDITTLKPARENTRLDAWVETIMMKFSKSRLLKVSFVKIDIYTSTGLTADLGYSFSLLHR